MKYLLDTHIFLWWLENPSLLSKEVTEIINDSKNIIYISSATIWEISIKNLIITLLGESVFSVIMQASLMLEVKKCALKKLAKNV